MEFIGINTVREAYAPMKNTCTVGEFIDMLSEFDADMPIMFRNDDGYTYGAIDEYGTIAHYSYDEEADEVTEL